MNTSTALPIRWFYASGKEKRGPYSEAEMGRFVQDQIINGESLVWNDSLPAWQLLRHSRLKNLISKTEKIESPVASRPGPPPCQLPEADKESRLKLSGLFLKIGAAIVVVILVALGLWLRVHSEQVDRTQEPVTQEKQDNPMPASPVVEPMLPEATPEPTATATPTPLQAISSSNPVIYSGSYINRSSGDTGDLILRVEHVISTGDGQFAFGGELIMNSASNSITGTYAPDVQQISFSPGVQSRVVWKGSINGESIKGEFNCQTYSGPEEGIWKVTHSGGGTFQELGTTR